MHIIRYFLLSALLLATAVVVAPWRSSAAEPPAKAAKDENPYLAGANLSRAELGKFLDAMGRKPESIRQRPGFSVALIEAADRILAEAAEDELATTALLVKFAALDDQAQHGDKAAGESLLELATQRLKDPREPIATESLFHLVQRRAQDAGQLDDDSLAALLKELKDFFGKATLDNRHLTLASLTVGLVNRLDDDTAAKSAYKQFGALWAKSKDPELAKYGRKIEKGPAEKKTPPKKE